MTLTGLITPPAENLTITLVFTSADGTLQHTVHASENGTLRATFEPPTQGDWMIQAMFGGNNMFYENSS